ncbi:uncharacterized protein LOC123298576 [Chrysoperla carnea]|uniref:uncharacterized protein LOC123298576 n=1 Tax=Chrysoperla carnea TaxID=189513 RepID=UPI001D07B1A3|nr:uncharacterized protein LOC123298576 [Chrysoperla carnea]
MASQKSKQHLSDYVDHFEEYMRVNHPKVLEHIKKTFNPSNKHSKDAVQKHKKGDPTSPSIVIEVASTSTKKDIAPSTNNIEQNESNKAKITRNDDSSHKSKENVKKIFKGDSSLTVSVEKNNDEVQTVRNKIKSNGNSDEEVESKRPKMSHNYNSTRRLNDHDKKDLSPNIRELEKNYCEKKKELVSKTKYDKQDYDGVQLIDNYEGKSINSDTNRMKNATIDHQPHYHSHSSQRYDDDLRHASSSKFVSSPEPGEIDYHTKSRHENRETHAYRLQEIEIDKVSRKSPSKRYNGKHDYNYYSSDQASRGTFSYERYRDTEKAFWIHVGRCELSTTENDVKELLKEKFPTYHFECEKQKIKEGDFNARFRVRVPRELESEILLSKHWPEGILATKFMNFRPPGTFKKM